MSEAEDTRERPAKRRKTSPSYIPPGNTLPDAATRPLASLSRSITPPRSRQPQFNNRKTVPSSPKPDEGSNQLKIIRSPIQLTHIRDFPNESENNRETIQLRDILGDPLIKQCWQFNYLFDIDFLMNQFDPDVKSLVQVKVIHGSWKRESSNRIRIDETCRRYPNVEPIVAYMPEPFGTHHSKMMILLRHDDQAQIVIHTANMVPGDWANMCQAVWRSPLLPLLPSGGQDESASEMTIGSGRRFKRDLLSYLEAYGPKKTGRLVQQLRKHDFAAIRAALVASVPSKQLLDDLDSNKQTLWGWPALKDTLRRVPRKESLGSESHKPRPHIVAQISSVATLGQSDKWLKETFFNSLSPSRPNGSFAPGPKFSIIFPTPGEIRRSLNGYGSGGSIHMKIVSAAQKKQLDYMRPYLCRWAGDADRTTDAPTAESDGKPPVREAGRRRAAPHIKTFIRFTDMDMTTIDWALVTSANLSTQAWGAAVNPKKEIRICSWEIGVLIWPDLFADASDGNGGSADMGAAHPHKSAKLVPCFKTDIPSPLPSTGDSPSTVTTLVGFRMPYDLPLQRYTRDDDPWCATSSYSEPDWLGQTWDSWAEK